MIPSTGLTSVVKGMDVVAYIDRHFYDEICRMNKTMLVINVLSNNVLLWPHSQNYKMMKTMTIALFPLMTNSHHIDKVCVHTGLDKSHHHWCRDSNLSKWFLANIFPGRPHHYCKCPELVICGMCSANPKQSPSQGSSLMPYSITSQHMWFL